MVNMAAFNKTDFNIIYNLKHQIENPVIYHLPFQAMYRDVYSN